MMANQNRRMMLKLIVQYAQGDSGVKKELKHAQNVIKASILRTRAR
jgi:hypothetical protein